MATIASDVIEAEVEDERITCKKGCRREGVSKTLLSMKIQHESQSSLSYQHTDAAS